MNSFGRLFRISIFGESHGECVGITIDGCPAGLSLSPEDMLPDLERRKGGQQKGTTPRQEDDFPIIKSGVFNGKTTGFPITILFENKNTRSEDYTKQRSIPRPGHADWVAHQKFGGFEDYRGGGHFSARLTAGIVAAGAIAKKLLATCKTSPPTPLQGRGASGDSALPGYMTNSPESWKLLVEFAKKNRKNPTEAEDKLWQAVRNRKINGYKFRRQHPVNSYIPDFICLEKKLIIEIDGGYRNEKEQQEYDALREKWLIAGSFKMLRFSNEQVLNNIGYVIKTIEDKLNEPEKEKGNLLRSGSGSPSPLERELEGEVDVAVENTIYIHAAVTEIAGEKDTEKGLQKAIDAKDSAGGIVECRVTGLPTGLGEPYFDSVESVLSHILFAIPAVRGVEFGTGFAAAGMFGSEHNDAIDDMSGKTRTNHAGGVVGGISNGNELVFRLAVKPTSSTPKEQNSLNWETGTTENFSIKGRHDLCVALRAPVIVEAVTAIVLTDFMLLEQKIKRIL
jgi:chorismate synthase/very-short-patch-repair endonuclease